MSLEEIEVEFDIRVKFDPKGDFYFNMFVKLKHGSA